MKKKIKALMVLVVMLISVLGSMSVSAEVITVQDFDSAYEEAFCHGYTARVDDGIGYKLELGQTYTFPLCVNYYSDPLYPDVSSVIDRLITSTFTLKSADNSVYCVFLRSERDLIPVIFSTGNFYIEYLFADEFKTIVDESGTSYLHDNGLSSAQKFFELKQYGNYYYASLYSGLFGLWNDYMQVSLPTYDVDGGKTSVGVIFKSFIDKYIDGSLNPPVVRGENGEDILVSDIENQFDESTATYSKDIGYLQNVKKSLRYVGDDYNSPDTMNGASYLRFSYSGKTNTGFDVTSSNVRVSLYSSFRGYYYTSLAQALKNNRNHSNANVLLNEKKLFNSYSDYGGLSVTTDYDSLYNLHSADIEKLDSLNGTIWVKATPNFDHWLRVEVYEDGAWKYGPWVRIINDTGTAVGQDSATGVTPDGTVDAESGYGDGTPVDRDSGAGETMEDADNNAINSSDYVTIDNLSLDSAMEYFINSLHSMISSVGEFPAVIGQLFSGFPAVVIASIGLGFIIAIILRVIGR